MNRVIGGEGRFGAPIPMTWSCAVCEGSCPEPLTVQVEDARLPDSARGRFVLHHTTLIAMQLRSVTFYGPYCSADCFRRDNDERR